MPYTINGIGTHYYGKDNVETRLSVCEHCGRQLTLSSYDTKLWFCVIFIPVIPLGRKRVMDECPGCTRHTVVGANEWETMRGDAIRGAREDYEANPQDAEKAVALHATLASGGEREAAGQFADVLQTQFSDHADMQLYLGGFYEDSQEMEKSNTCFHRMYEIDKDNTVAQKVSAVALLREEKPEAARERLAQVTAAGEPIDPSIAFPVAAMLHAKQDFASAGDLLKQCVEANPQIQSDKTYRKLATEIEQATGELGALVAPRGFFQKPTFWWSLAAALLLSFVIGLDGFFSSYQKLYVVNGLLGEISVSLDDGKPFTVQGGSKLRREVSSGSHRISVVAPERLVGEQEFVVSAGFFNRWFRKPVHVVDPTRSSILVWEETIYTDEEVDESEIGYELTVGEPYKSYSHVDYAFREFPNQIEVKGSVDEVKKSRVGMIEGGPWILVVNDPARFEDPGILDFMEQHLLCPGDHEQGLSLYMNATMTQGVEQRSLKFLESGLDVQPIDVQWHRTYQTLAQILGTQGLKRRYDALLQTQPNNASLLYLRARLEDYKSFSEPYYRKALEQDPKNVFVLVGAAYNALIATEYDQAFHYANDALAQDPEDKRANEIHRQASIVLARQTQVERKARREIDQYPISYDEVMTLMTCYASRGRTDLARGAFEEFAQAVDKEWPADPHGLKQRAEIRLLLLEGKPADAEQVALSCTDPVTKAVHLYCCALLMGDPITAVEQIPILPESEHAEMQLWTAISCLVDYDSDGVLKHRSMAAQLYNKQEGVGKKIAVLLASDRNDSLGRAMDIVSEPHIKAALLVLLSSTSNQENSEALQMAERLNRIPSIYQPLLTKAIDQVSNN